MLYSVVHLYYNFGVVRRVVRTIRTVRGGCKPPKRKKFQKIQLVDSAGLFLFAGSAGGAVQG